MVVETVRETPDVVRPNLSTESFDGMTRAGILKQLLQKHKPAEGEK